VELPRILHAADGFDADRPLLTDRPEAQRMISGRTIVIKGDISGNEDLVIAGRVEGSITLEGRVLTLAPESHVVGTINAAAVVVSGTVEGSIVAAERLEIRTTATVEGDLSAPALVVADGATLSVIVDMPARTAP
jgi:cytoskeletal protein CcmA (bactofilin family)